MALLTPIVIPIPIRQDQAELLAFRGTSGRLEADFRSGPTRDATVRVACEGVVQFKLSEEMIFSIEERLVGNAPTGFAYTVENGQILDLLSDSIQAAYRNRLKHYLLISLNECLEFISTEPPSFELIPA